MPKISVDKIEPGMTLLKPVTRGNMVMLNEGTELTEKMILKIRSMEIETIFIDGPSLQSIPREEMLAQLDMRFKKVENMPYMNLLKKIVREHKEGLYEQ